MGMVFPRQKKTWNTQVSVSAESDYLPAIDFKLIKIQRMPTAFRRTRPPDESIRVYRNEQCVGALWACGLIISVDVYQREVRPPGGRWSEGVVGKGGTLRSPGNAILIKPQAVSPAHGDAQHSAPGVFIEALKAVVVSFTWPGSDGNSKCC